ncbi:MAG: 16S rRNA (cytidine(1402)-2'-O)-methyltransferase [Thermoleophilia bacterium]
MLYVCPTPIGNLEDVTLRVLETLRQADVVLCEDTRHSSGLFRRHGVSPRSLLSFHEHNEETRVQRVLALLRDGKNVALVTDAGMPGLSDPGFTLVRACVAAGVEVTVLPGASAVTTALVASGLPTDRFTFVGFLPRGRVKVAAALEDAGAVGGTVVAFESPHRLRSTLGVIAERWPSRPLAVCRELTKMHEEVLRGTAGEVLESLGERVRGEIVVVLGPADMGPRRTGTASAGSVGAESGVTGAEAAMQPAAANLRGAGAGDEVRAALDLLLARGFRTKEASILVSRLSGTDPRRIYALAQEAKQEAKRRSGGGVP